MAGLPLLVLAVRRRPPFCVMAVVSLLLTAAFYTVNKRVTYSAPDLIRSVLDYIPPVALGIWMGGRRDSWRQILAKGWSFSLLLSAAGAVYVPLAIQADLLNGPVDGLRYQAGWWAYTTGVSFLLMALAYRIEEAGALSVALQYLGRCSMQIYLAHLLLLLWLDTRPGIFNLCGVAGAFWLYLAGAVIGPVILAEICTRARVSAVLFGR